LHETSRYALLDAEEVLGEVLPDNVARRSTLQAQDMVQLLFDCTRSGGVIEQAWVLIIGSCYIDGSIHYLGVMTSTNPVPEMRYGDIVVFDPRHVALIQRQSFIPRQRRRDDASA
jgi:hypothetical protein